MPGTAFTDRDARKAAQLLLKQHGENAAAVARAWIEDFRAQGRAGEGERIWRRILQSVEQMTDEERFSAS